MLESKWGLRFFALILALLLFLSVNNVLGDSFTTDNIAKDGHKTIKNVPVEVINNNKDLYVSGAPDTVDVELNGPQSKVLQATKVEDYKVTLDATDASTGEQTIAFQVRGLDRDINYRVYPKEATLSIEKKESREVAIEPNISRYAVDPNYQVSEATVKNHTVKVIGGKEQLDRIAFAKASLREDFQITQKTTAKANVAVFDKNMNKLDVQVVPSTVDVTVDVEPYHKKVKIDLTKKGTAADGFKVSDVTLDKSTIDLYGNREALEDIDKISGEVDVNGVSTTTTRSVKLDLPDQVSYTKPADVTATISVE
ncbi:MULTISPECIES: CdaR family protein [unclassified Staphylococcus]|uniref:CdaR family protein n=1 Tax=unclassified Staphylococcus TaxID=91994 RepID=UPI0021CDFF90|nr:MULTISPECIES: CdaR family protein [unclassified Staphylococcus]UXR77912.1 CdaR family protein [Staphylococcus sp. IVB6227]UXR82073.1 CdaR family protein [Staphylococcus sp. IVB6214]